MDADMDWKRCVQEFFNDSTVETSFSKEISNAICKGDIKLAALVEKLEATITSTDIPLREKGIKLMSEVINYLPRDLLTAKEVETMVEFMTFRLQDHHTIIPHAIQGLLFLSQCNTLPKEYGSKILLGIFKDVHVPSQLQNDRYAVYQMIASLLQSHLEDLKNVQSMVFGFIQVLDGERDPRCLLLAFHIVPQLAKHFNLDPFEEDLFEVIACYFPIDFNPKQSPTCSVTKEDLTRALHKCLVLTPKFAPFCLPILLEKLESNVPNARLCAYHVLESSCKVFSPKDFQPFLVPLWAVIQNEVFMGNKEELDEAALQSLTALICAITPNNSDDNTECFKEFLGEVLKECEHHLCQQKFMQIPCSAKILAAVASASTLAADNTLSFVMPLLLQQFAVQTRLDQRKAILEMAIKLVVSVKQVSYKNGLNPLERFQDSILSLFFSVLDDNTSDELGNLGLFALSEALGLKSFLEERHLELLAHHLVHILISEERENLRANSFIVLSKLSNFHPAVTLTHIMPVLKEQLNDLKSVNAEMNNQIFGAFISASSHSDVLQQCLEFLIEFLDKQILGEVHNKNSVITARSILSVIDTHLPTISLPINYITSSVMEPLIGITLRTAFRRDILDEEMFESIEVISDIINKIVCSLESSIISPYLTAAIQLHLSGEVQDIFIRISSMELLMTSSLSKTVALLLVKCVLAGIPNSCNIPNLEDFLQYLKTLAINSKDLYLAEASAQCVAIIVNKMGNNDQLLLILSSFYEFLQKIIENESDSDERCIQNALLMWIWISKALVLRSHPQMTTFVSKLISWLENNLLGNTAAEGFSTIVEYSPKIFSIEGHSHIRFLYRQRLFIETSPKLCKEYSEAAIDHKTNYLTALCSQLKYLPKTVLSSELPLLLPIMLQSLHHNSTSLLLTVLTCIEDILKDDPSLVREHLNDLVPQLLSLANSHSSMKVKIHSLSCLALLCSIPGHHLLSVRNEVIQKLKPCLDDKKRFVRRAAVEARCKWYLLGQPGS